MRCSRVPHGREFDLALLVFVGVGKSSGIRLCFRKRFTPTMVRLPLLKVRSNRGESAILPDHFLDAR